MLVLSSVPLAQERRQGGWLGLLKASGKQAFFWFDASDTDERRLPGEEIGTLALF